MDAGEGGLWGKGQGAGVSGQLPVQILEHYALLTTDHWTLTTNKSLLPQISYP